MRSFFPILLIACFFSYKDTNAQGADSLLRFIDNHKEKSSLYIIRNDTILASLNENKMMPLASTMKIMVALEFSKQAAFKVFDTSKMVALSELNKYYLPLTDGNAHPNWLDYEKKNGGIVNDSVSLLNVARGMIIFSSNANTEYLMDLLGLQNINGNYRLMNIKDFTPLYYPVSSLFLYQNPKKLKEEKVLKEINFFSENDLIKATEVIHKQLKDKPEYKSTFNFGDLTPAMQKNWSNRLPSSTTAAYARIAYVLNNRGIFGKETYQVLERVLESIMENPANRQWLDHAGMKNGSTMYVLTNTMYATLKNGNRIAMAYFFNDLDPADGFKLQNWMNDFEIEVLTNPEFVKKLSGI